MADKIGFIGLGLMGSRMALRLAQQGYDVGAYNRTPDRAQNLADKGVRLRESPAECAEGAAAVILMVTDAGACRDVLFGERGLAKSESPVLVINMSTISPDQSKELAELLTAAGHRYIEVPVYGSTAQVNEGTLVLLAGGEEKDLDDARQILQVLGERIFHVGPVGHAAAMKLIHNMVVGIHMQALAEALGTGKAYGLEIDKIIEILAAGVADSKVRQIKGPQVLQNDFAPRFPLKHQLKDLKLADDLTKQLEVPTPLVAAAAWTYERALKDGLGDQDTAAICSYLMLD